MSQTVLRQPYSATFLYIGSSCAIVVALYSAHHFHILFECTILFLMMAIIGFSTIIIVKRVGVALSTHIIFIDMPDPDNYAAVLLRAHQSQSSDHCLAVAGRWILRRLGFPLSPLYIVCGGRRVNLGLAHKNTNGTFFDESSQSYVNWDFRRHVGTLPADEAVMNDRGTTEDSALVLKKNMYDLECILRCAGFTEFVLVTGHIASQIPLSYSHHADEWRFYDNCHNCWVTPYEYDQLSNKRCDESDVFQNFDQRRKLARQFINQLTGINDFALDSVGSHWLTLDQLYPVLCRYSTVHMTVGGPATDVAYLVEKSSTWTRNVNTISAMWAVFDLGQNTGKMNLCGMNFNEAADRKSAKYLSSDFFPNAMFSLLPTETCKLTPGFKVSEEMAERIDILRPLAGKITLWSHAKGGCTEPLFDYFICESPDIIAALQKLGLIKVFVTLVARKCAVLSPSEAETQFTAWVNTNMFTEFTWGPNDDKFVGTHWCSAKSTG